MTLASLEAQVVECVKTVETAFIHSFHFLTTIFHSCNSHSYFICKSYFPKPQLRGSLVNVFSDCTFFSSTWSKVLTTRKSSVMLVTSLCLLCLQCTAIRSVAGGCLGAQGCSWSEGHRRAMGQAHPPMWLSKPLVLPALPKQDWDWSSVRHRLSPTQPLRKVGCPEPGSRPVHIYQQVGEAPESACAVPRQTKDHAVKPKVLMRVWRTGLVRWAQGGSVCCVSVKIKCASSEDQRAAEGTSRVRKQSKCAAGWSCKSQGSVKKVQRPFPKPLTPILAVLFCVVTGHFHLHCPLCPCSYSSSPKSQPLYFPELST